MCIVSIGRIMGFIAWVAAWLAEWMVASVTAWEAS